MTPHPALLALTLAALVAAQQIPTIRVPVRLVTIPVLAFSKENRILPNLQTGDFHVLDNGRRQAATLNASTTPVSIALAIQANREVREYLPFIAQSGSALDALLVGETGESAVVTYSDDVRVVKPFGAGDLQTALRQLSSGGTPARMIDAGLRAISLLAALPGPRARVLLIVGQPMDSGSESTLATLRERAEKENVAIHCLSLPEVNQAFVADTFSLQGLSKAERGGFKAGTDLAKLIGVLSHSADSAAGADPFSILTAATGGTRFHFRKQRQLEDAVAAIGVELRSAYLLTYYPNSQDAGYHTVRVEVDVPGAKIYARPGYWLSTE